jgi:ADP-ribosylglycohydrolase
MVLGINVDRSAGVLLGLAAGDALGAGYEFASPPAEGDARMIGGGLGAWDPGEWTDDTQMALCIAQETATGTLDPRAVAQRFWDWYQSGPADVGIQTRAVLASAHDAVEVAARAVARFAANPASSAGNGSLMRTAPVALFTRGDEALSAMANEISALTHADPLAGEACALWCVAINRAIHQGRLDGIDDGLALLPEHRRSFWATKIDEARTSAPATFRPNGFVVTALQAALAAITQTPVPADQPARHLRLALQKAVAIGDDTDTVAAIAGALLGARWGASAIPPRWTAMLHGWPGFHAGDLLRLGVLSSSHGRSDGADWPKADDLTGYYRRLEPMSPLAVALPDDPGVTLANMAGAATVPADVVVSLCRVGARQLDGGLHARVVLLDSDDPADNPNLTTVFADLATDIAGWRAEGKTVLVHCVHAQRRTPAVAAAYLAERLGISGADAWARAAAALPRPKTNIAFRNVLDELWP